MYRQRRITDPQEATHPLGIDRIKGSSDNLYQHLVLSDGGDPEVGLELQDFTGVAVTGVEPPLHAVSVGARRTTLVGRHGDCELTIAINKHRQEEAMEGQRREGGHTHRQADREASGSCRGFEGLVFCNNGELQIRMSRIYMHVMHLALLR